MKKVTLLILIGFIVSCSSKVNLKDDNEIASSLAEKILYLGGDLTFNTNGTFELIPASYSDPTRKYTGKWKLGECKNCDPQEGNESREITLEFNERGHVTDDYTFNGSNFQGYGSHLHGWLSTFSGSSFGKTWKIEFDDNHPSGWKYTVEHGTELNTSTTFSRELEVKK